MRSALSVCAALHLPLLWTGTASAQAPTPAVEAPAAPPTPLAPAIPPAPYSLPWQLRPAAVGNVVRFDNSYAFYEVGEKKGQTLASMLLATYKINPSFSALLRLALVRNGEPGPISRAAPRS